jgi:hypothetical protein
VHGNGLHGALCAGTANARWRTAEGKETRKEGEARGENKLRNRITDDRERKLIRHKNDKRKQN